MRIVYALASLLVGCSSVSVRQVLIEPAALERTACVAVVPFVDGGDGRVGRAMAEAVASAVLTTEAMNVLGPSEVEQVLALLGARPIGVTTPPLTPLEVAAALGVDAVLSGTVTETTAARGPGAPVSSGLGFTVELVAAKSRAPIWRAAVTSSTHRVLLDLRTPRQQLVRESADDVADLLADARGRVATDRGLCALAYAQLRAPPDQASAVATIAALGGGAGVATPPTSAAATASAMSSNGTESTLPALPADAATTLPALPNATESALPALPTDATTRPSPSGAEPALPGATESALPALPADAAAGLPALPGDTEPMLPGMPADTATAAPARPVVVATPAVAKLKGEAHAVAQRLLLRQPVELRGAFPDYKKKVLALSPKAKKFAQAIGAALKALPTLYIRIDVTVGISGQAAADATARAEAQQQAALLRELFEKSFGVNAVRLTTETHTVAIAKSGDKRNNIMAVSPVR